ncbi:MAG: DinB family protein [Chloroflexota bacterium]
MDTLPAFLARHQQLHGIEMAYTLQPLSEAQLRQRPHGRLNSIVWNLWHMARSEDFGINRLVVDQGQLFYEDRWQLRLNIPYRHQGTGMISTDVDDLSKRINIEALLGYFQAVGARTQSIVQALDCKRLQETPAPDHLKHVVFDEGIFMRDCEQIMQYYQARNKGWFLMHLGLTHNFQHYGEIVTLASLVSST